ncbi:major histocompatibility complex class I-related gene protein-like isoform 2-T2 [Discoglossus pictus]
MYLLLVLLIMEVSEVYCDTHSLLYFYTGVSDPAHGPPQFSAVGYVDDIQIMRYVMDTHQARPAVQWMERIEGDPGYWNRDTQNFKGAEVWFKHTVKLAMSRFNHTGGFHSFQVMSGCDLYDDSSSRWFLQYAYDGRDFMVLDMDSMIWVPLINEAQITSERWTRPDNDEAVRWKNYLKETCIDWLKIYMAAGKDDLERRVPPRVKISHHQSDGVTKLHCHVYGFYPRDVDVKWVKNGLEDVYSEEAKQILPNPDGTYQTRVTVEVTPQEGDSYECHVDHSSLDETMMMITPWDPPKDKNLPIIIGVIVLIAAIAGTGIGFVVYRKKSGKMSPMYTPAAPSDSSSG